MINQKKNGEACYHTMNWIELETDYNLCNNKMWSNKSSHLMYFSQVSVLSNGAIMKWKEGLKNNEGIRKVSHSTLLQ